VQAVLPRFVFTRHVPSLECVPYTADMTFIPNCNDFEICSKCLLKLFTFRYRNVISYMKSRQNQPCFRWVRGIRSRSFLGAYLTTLYYRDYRSRQQSVLGRALSLLPRKPGLWVPIPLGAWMLVFVYVCAFFCVCVQVEALGRADHPSKESYRLSLIKKLRKLSPILQKREQATKRGSNEEGKKL
jgi:hypothetical protein